MEVIREEVRTMIAQGAGYSACLAWCLNQVAHLMVSQEDYLEYKRSFEKMLEEEFGLDPEDEDDTDTTPELVGPIY